MNTIHFSFYKSLLPLCQLLYAFHSNFSSTSLFDGFFILSYNTFYTILPAFFYGILEKRYRESTLIRNPKLYKINHRQTGVSALLRWCIFAVWHTVVIFYGWKLAIQGATAQNCNSGMSLQGFGSQVGGSCVTVANLKILLEAHDWNIPFSLSVFIRYAYHVQELSNLSVLQKFLDLFLFFQFQALQFMWRVLF